MVYGISFTLYCVAGFIIGAIAGSHTGSVAEGAAAGGEAATKFTSKYGWIFFIVSALVAIIGTKTGKLPFMKKHSQEKTKVTESGPEN